MRKKQAKATSSIKIWTGLGIFLLAVVVRGLYLYDSSDNPTFYAPIVDSLTYDQMARGLLGDTGLTHEFFWQPPFYPLFLSLVYLLSNCSIVGVKLVQMILGGVTCVLAYLLGAKLFGRRAGILAGVITGAYVPLVFFEEQLLAAGWAAFFSVAVVLCLLGTKEKMSVWRCFSLGLCGAFSIIVRPVFLPVLACGCLWLLVVGIRERIGIKKLSFGTVGFAAGFLAVAGPMAILSYHAMGRAKILPYSGGVNLYIGNNPNYRETVNIRPGLGWRKLTGLPHRHGVKDRYGQDEFFTRKVAEYAVSQPVSFSKGLAYKATQFLSSRETPRNVDVYLFRRWSGLLRAGVWKVGRFGFPFGVLLPLAVIGILFHRREVPAPIWLFLVLYPASVILVFVTSRYRMPIIPVMSVLAAAGCGAIWRALKGRGWRSLAVALVVFLAMGIISSAPGPFYAEQLDYEPELYYGLADSLDKRGRAPEAIEAYSRAVTLKGDYVEAHHNLGLLLVKQQRLSEAIAHYERALEVDPKNAGLHEDLGVALFKQGRTKEAIEQYYRAAEIDPNKASVYDNLGTAFFRLNRLAEALKHYSRSVELNPRDAALQNNIGNVLALLGQPEKAVEHYEISLRIRPEDPETLSNLANALAALGRFDEAVEKYTEALRIAPRDGGILCNLGACFERQGNIEKALEAYRRATALDPDNKRARQALERLSR
ncbi:MAG: tetratricopeptide repeat protein [Planctomycetota bacterium]|jgi:tetratricopeptide (TPR) repeat protein